MGGPAERFWLSLSQSAHTCTPHSKHATENRQRPYTNNTVLPAAMFWPMQLIPLPCPTPIYLISLSSPKNTPVSFTPSLFPAIAAAAGPGRHKPASSGLACEECCASKAPHLCPPSPPHPPPPLLQHSRSATVTAHSDSHTPIAAEQRNAKPAPKLVQQTCSIPDTCRTYDGYGAKLCMLCFSFASILLIHLPVWLY